MTFPMAAQAETYFAGFDSCTAPQPCILTAVSQYYYCFFFFFFFFHLRECAAVYFLHETCRPFVQNRASTMHKKERMRTPTDTNPRGREAREAVRKASTPRVQLVGIETGEQS